MPATSRASRSSPDVARLLGAKYVREILELVAWHRYVLYQHVLECVWGRRGMNPRSGARKVQRLADSGLLTMERIDSTRGRASQKALSLTRDGWFALQQSPPSSDQRRLWSRLRDYFLQFAEVKLKREDEGFRFVGRGATDRETGTPLPFQILRQWALKQFEGRALGPDERMLRESLRRAPTFKIDVDLFHHPDREQVRLVLPVRLGLNLATKLEGLTKEKFAGFPTLHFELVCSDMAALKEDRKLARRWAKKRRFEVQLHRVPHFKQRESPYSHSG